MPAIKELLTQQMTVVTAQRELLDRLEKEGRDPTGEERQILDRQDKELDGLDQQIQDFNKNKLRRDRGERIAGDGAELLKRQSDVNDPGQRDSLTETELKLVHPRLMHRFGSIEFGKSEEVHTFAKGSNESLRASGDYLSSFRSYVAGRNPAQQLGLQTDDATKGGYLAPMMWVSELIKFLDNSVFMRQICRVESMPGVVSLGVPTYETDPNDADWTNEVPASDISEDDNMAFGKREFVPQLLTKLLKISQKLLRSKTLTSAESLIIQRLGYVFSITEEQAFMTGNGSKKPLGIFTASADGIPSSRDVDSATTTTVTWDNMMDTLGNLKEGYQRNSTWVLNRQGVTYLRKLKDGGSAYHWQPSLVAGTPNMILNRPYFTSEYAPYNLTSGNYFAICGDFSFYWIVDSLQLAIERLGELFTLKNQVGFKAAKETDGMPVLGEAFSRLVIKS